MFERSTPTPPALPATVNENVGIFFGYASNLGPEHSMIDPEGNVHTAHTTTPVDFIVYDPAQPDHEPREGPEAGRGDADMGAPATEADPARRGGISLWANGRLADVAPTVLGYMGIEQPDVMTGENLVLAPEAEGVRDDE